MATTRMTISLPVELRQRMAAVGIEYSEAARQGFERAVAWREGKTPYPDPSVIMAHLIPVLTDAEVSETLMLLATRATTAPYKGSRQRLLSRLARGDLPTNRPDEAAERVRRQRDEAWEALEG